MILPALIVALLGALISIVSVLILAILILPMVLRPYCAASQSEKEQHSAGHPYTYSHK
jgi:ABC-type antimicrobial peptide transport system permease subunit